MIKTEKLYKELINVKSLLDEKEQRYIDEFAKNYQGGEYLSTFATEFALILQELKAQIAEESAKTSGTDKLLKIAKNIMKDGSANGRYKLGFGLLLDRYGDPHEYFCDGFRMLSVGKHFDNIETYSESDVLRCDNIMPKDRDLINEIERPNLQDLKTYNKICKAENKNLVNKNVTFDFGSGHPLVNSQWLAEALEALPNAKLYEVCMVGEFENRYYSQIVLWDKEQDVKLLILGIRETNNNNTTRVKTDLKAV